MQRTAETMARLVCRASLLKSDDPRIKGTSLSSRICKNCDLGVVESVYHLVMQCHNMEDISLSMYNQLQCEASMLNDRLRESPQDSFPYLLGMTMLNVELDKVIAGLQISGRYICLMYKRVINARKGIV